MLLRRSARPRGCRRRTRVHRCAAALYDDFATPRIDRERWQGYAEVVAYASARAVGDGWTNFLEDAAISNPARSAANELAVREIDAGRLRLALTTHGAGSSPSVVPGYGRLGLRPRVSVTGSTRVQARVTVVDAVAEACDADPGRTRAELLAESRGGIATLALERGTFTGDRIVAVVGRCRNDSCRWGEDVGWVVFERGWTPGVPHVLTITEQADRNRFVFTVSGGVQPAETRAIAYPPVAPPSDGLGFGLRVVNHPAFCPPSPDGAIPRARTTMDARFDTVRVNGTIP